MCSRRSDGKRPPPRQSVEKIPPSVTGVQSRTLRKVLGRQKKEVVAAYDGVRSGGDCALRKCRDRPSCGRGSDAVLSKWTAQDIVIISFHVTLLIGVWL